MTNAERRFWDKVTITDTCWTWGGAKYKGYGQFTLTWWKTEQGRWQCKTVRAHRLAYEWLVGPIPDGLTIDHECFNRSCVRPGPGHCVPRTVGDNGLRGHGPAAMNKRKTHCKYGHEFTPSNTITRPSNPHWRECRICHTEGRRRRNEKRARNE